MLYAATRRCFAKTPSIQIFPGMAQAWRVMWFSTGIECILETQRKTGFAQGSLLVHSVKSEIENDQDRIVMRSACIHARGSQRTSLPHRPAKTTSRGQRGIENCSGGRAESGPYRIG